MGRIRYLWISWMKRLGVWGLVYLCWIWILRHWRSSWRTVKVNCIVRSCRRGLMTWSWAGHYTGPTLIIVWKSWKFNSFIIFSYLFFHIFNTFFTFFYTFFCFFCVQLFHLICWRGLKLTVVLGFNFLFCQKLISLLKLFLNPGACMFFLLHVLIPSGYWCGFRYKWIGIFCRI